MDHAGRRPSHHTTYPCRRRSTDTYGLPAPELSPYERASPRPSAAACLARRRPCSFYSSCGSCAAEKTPGHELVHRCNFQTVPLLLYFPPKAVATAVVLVLLIRGTGARIWLLLLLQRYKYRVGIEEEGYRARKLHFGVRRSLFDYTRTAEDLSMIVVASTERRLKEVGSYSPLNFWFLPLHVHPFPLLYRSKVAAGELAAVAELGARTGVHWIGPLASQNAACL